MSRVFNRALAFPQGLESTSNFIQPAVDNWTYSAWVYPTAFPPAGGNNGAWIIGFNGSDYGMWITPSSPNGGAFAGITAAGKVISKAVSVDGTFVLNQWQYATYTYNATTGVSRLFINGVEVSYASQTNAIPTDNNFYPIEIGNQQPIGVGGQTYNFSGYIDTVGVWQDLLTTTQMIAASKYNGTPTTDVGWLSGYWPLLGNTLPEPQSPTNTFPLAVDTSHANNLTPQQGPNSPGQTNNVFIAATPFAVTVCNSSGFSIPITSATLGNMQAAPTPVCFTDINGNEYTVTGGTLGAFVANPTPVVLCDGNGHPLTPPIVYSSNGNSYTISATLTGKHLGQPIPVRLCNSNGLLYTVSGFTTGTFIANETSIVLTDSRGYEISSTGLST